MTLRDAYLAWTRRAVAVLLVPLGLTAGMQAASSSPGWASGPEAGLGVRSLFIAVAVAAVAMGRGIRQRDTARRPLTERELVALSWRLLILALSPSAIGAVLALMTRSMLDYYLLLVVALVGIALLYPRFDQWQEWASPEGKDDR
jgi:hypothetical protein